jgi:hypothetical protein
MRVGMPLIFNVTDEAREPAHNNSAWGYDTKGSEKYLDTLA